MKLKSFLLFGLFLTGLALPFGLKPVQAESLTCIDDYYGFILTVRSENSRSESITDMFSLGYCQLNDILDLDDELDQLKENFRTTAEACGSTSTYKKDYQRILMEMYFVRHLKEGGVLNAVDEAALESLKEEKLATLKSTMEKIFVDDEARVDGPTFDSYFESWSAKYDDRIADYRKCEEGPWAELTSTWTDFVQKIKDLDFTVKTDDGKSIQEILTPDTGSTEQDMTALGNSLKNAWEFLKGEEERRKAEIPSPQSVSDVGNQGGSITVDQALDALNSSLKDYSLEERSAERLASYSQLYGAGGSVQATNLQSIMTQLNAVLQEANNKDLPSIAANAAKVSDKQCK